MANGIVRTDFSEFLPPSACSSRIWTTMQTAPQFEGNYRFPPSGRTPTGLSATAIVPRARTATSSDQFRGYLKCIRSPNSWKGRQATHLSLLMNLSKTTVSKMESRIVCLVLNSSLQRTDKSIHAEPTGFNQILRKVGLDPRYYVDFIFLFRTSPCGPAMRVDSIVCAPECDSGSAD
ncbi:MAG: hypothetical protein JWM11_1101 [Planctomycetaceae bacterium]|nr:hypothetical protein [Planctomycetaceae bacterium]